MYWPRRWGIEISSGTPGYAECCSEQTDFLCEGRGGEWGGKGRGGEGRGGEGRGRGRGRGVVWESVDSAQVESRFHLGTEATFPGHAENQSLAWE